MCNSDRQYAREYTRIHLLSTMYVSTMYADMINYVHDTNGNYASRVHLLISCRSDLPAENITFPCVPPRHLPSTSTAPGGFLWESFSASLCIKPLRYSCVPQVFMNSSVGVGFRPPIGASPSWWAHLLCCTTHKPNS